MSSSPIYVFMFNLPRNYLICLSHINSWNRESVILRTYFCEDYPRRNQQIRFGLTLMACSSSNFILLDAPRPFESYTRQWIPWNHWLRWGLVSTRAVGSLEVEIKCLKCSYSMKFGRFLGSSAAEMPAKFQSEKQNLNWSRVFETLRDIVIRGFMR